MAARVAMLGGTGTTSEQDETHESSDEPLVDSSSESQDIWRSKELWGTGGRGGEARFGL